MVSHGSTQIAHPTLCSIIYLCVCGCVCAILAAVHIYPSIYFDVIKNHGNLPGQHARVQEPQNKERNVQGFCNRESNPGLQFKLYHITPDLLSGLLAGQDRSKNHLRGGGSLWTSLQLSVWSVSSLRTCNDWSKNRLCVLLKSKRRHLGTDTIKLGLTLCHHHGALQGVTNFTPRSTSRI
jgi:hypothetical protein